MERIGRAEKVVVGYVEAMIPEGVKESWRGVKDRFKGAKEDVAREMPQVEQYGIVGKRTEEAGVGQVGAGFDHGVLEAELENESERASECRPILVHLSRLAIISGEARTRDADQRLLS